VWVIGHRGASGHAPENTLAAFRRAVELGARFIETDLQLSRDAQFVCIHDPTLDRTTNGRGPVHGQTLAELRQLDAGSWFSAEFAGERIPTLDEVLEFANEADVNLYLELKTAGAWGAAQTLVGAVTVARATARAVVISFDSATLEAARQREPTLMTGLLFDRDTPGIVKEAVRVGARQIAPRASCVTPELIADARRADLQVVAWTVNDPADMRRLAAVGVQGIITDYPDRFAALGA
jgi:glycerophosphoryl diester phosphodiesterase